MWLKRFFFIFLIISALFLLSLCFIDKKTKPQKTFSKIFPSYQVPLKEKKLDLKKPLLNLKAKEVSTPPYQINENQKRKTFHFISFSKCVDNTQAPDTLSKKFNTLTKEDATSNKHNILNKIDCGLIQTNFPLNF